MMIDAAFEGIRIEDVMTPASELRSVPPDLPVDRLLELMFRERHTVYPVARNGELVGLITIPDVRSVSPGERATTSVADVMTPADEIATVSPETEVIEALRMLAGEDIGRVLVVDDAGRIAGIVTRMDLMTVFEIARGHGRIGGRFPRSPA